MGITESVQVMNTVNDADTGRDQVQNWVWNTGTLAWERMKQPTVEIAGDLTVTMGDLEKLLANDYWKVSQYDWTSGDLDYKGFNVTLAAADAATTWYIWKYTWSTGNPTKIQGPLVGSWTGRAALGW